jgi:hypothetical protein
MLLFLLFLINVCNKDCGIFQLFFISMVIVTFDA